MLNASDFGKFILLSWPSEPFPSVPQGNVKANLLPPTTSQNSEDFSPGILRQLQVTLAKIGKAPAPLSHPGTHFFLHDLRRRVP